MFANCFNVDGSDYTGGLYNVTFAQGSSEAELYIPIVNDGILEPEESFTATLSVPEEAAQLGVKPGNDSEATVTITDDDSKIVNFSPTEYSVTEDGSSAVLMLMLNAPAGEDCTVQVETSDGTAEGKYIPRSLICRSDMSQQLGCYSIYQTLL